MFACFRYVYMVVFEKRAEKNLRGCKCMALSTLESMGIVLTTCNKSFCKDCIGLHWPELEDEVYLAVDLTVSGLSDIPWCKFQDQVLRGSIR